MTAATGRRSLLLHGLPLLGGLLVLLLRRSDAPTLLGRYSPPYAILLVAYGVLAVALLSWLRRQAVPAMTSGSGAWVFAVTALLWVPVFLHDVQRPGLLSDVYINPTMAKIATVLSFSGLALMLLLSGWTMLALRLWRRSLRRERSEQLPGALECAAACWASGTFVALTFVWGAEAHYVVAALGASTLILLGSAALLTVAPPSTAAWVIASSGLALWVGFVGQPIPNTEQRSVPVALGALSVAITLLALALTSRLRWLLVGTAAILALLPAIPRSPRAWSAEQPAAGDAGRPRRPNVLVIVADSLRADHLGPWGYAQDTSPAIDAMLASGTQPMTLFTDTWSSAAWTIPSTGGLFTGTLSSSWGSTSGPPEPLTTLAESFQRAGHATGAFVANHVLARQGFAQGFDRYQVLQSVEELQGSFLFGRLLAAGAPDRPLRWAERWGVHKVPGDAVWDIARGWMESRRGAPFFTYLHLMETHWPYADHGYVSVSGRVTGATPSYLDLLALGRSPTLSRPTPLPPGVDALIGRYDQEVRHVDTLLGRIWRDLETSGMLDSTLIVVTADHGEEFFEHGGYGHGYDVLPQMLHVPLIVKWPREDPYRSAPPSIQTPVSLLDVFPTLADLLELPRPSQGTIGRSWVPFLLEAERDAPFRPLLAEAREHGGAIVSAYREREVAVRLVASAEVPPIATNQAAIFASSDGRRLLNAADGEALVTRARQSWMPIWEQWRSAQDHRKGLGEDAAERLKALGYIR